MRLRVRRPRRRQESLLSIGVAGITASMLSIICLIIGTNDGNNPWTLSTIVSPVQAFSAADPQSSNSVSKILVTGAAGKTGRLVLSKLEQDPRYEPKALVRNERSARSLLTQNNRNNNNRNNDDNDDESSSSISTINGGVNGETLPPKPLQQSSSSQHNNNNNINVPLEHILIADITSPTFVETTSRIPGLIHDGGIDAMIICTSSVPQLRKRSLVKTVLMAPINLLRRKPLMDFRSLTFRWKHDGYPERVDYYGQIAQIKLAQRLKIPHIVLVSSMGVTDPSNFLNSVGKNTGGRSSYTKKNNKNVKNVNVDIIGNDDRQEEEEGHGDILVWKRRAEKYLVEESGLDYTIIHPGGLVDTPGGSEEFVLDVDDNLYNQTGVIRQTRISREDVADLCVAALSVGKNKKVSFDCITRPIQHSTSSSENDFSSTIVNGIHDDDVHHRSSVGSNKKSAEDALTEFLESSKTADYASM